MPAETADAILAQVDQALERLQMAAAEAAQMRLRGLEISQRMLAELLTGLRRDLLRAAQAGEQWRETVARPTDG